MQLQEEKANTNVFFAQGEITRPHIRLAQNSYGDYN